MEEKNRNAAQAASRLSARFATEGNKQAWLDLFADDAVVRDPIGKSVLDPEGNGHRGKAAITAFWDNVIGSQSLDFRIRESHPSGEYWCANVATLTSKPAGGEPMTTDLVIAYEANDAGKLVSLTAYWDIKKVMGEV